MGAFGGLLLTNKGRNLQTKAQSGVQLNFTNIKIGDGSLSGQSILELNNLISPKKTLSILSIDLYIEGQAKVKSYLSNADILSGFYWREIGIFAMDPDEGEILYCYGNAGANAEYIPAGGGPDVIERYINVITLIGNASNVSATLSSEVYVTQLDLEDALADKVDKVDGKGLSTEDYSTLEKARLSMIGTTFTNTSGTDSYTITIPGITDQTNLLGVPLKFLATIANTTGCTLNVNGFGAYAINKDVSVALETGDILANSLVMVVWDGTRYQVMEMCGVVTKNGTQTLINKTFTSPTLTTPKMTSGGYFSDANGNELIKFPTTVASAVNEITIENAIATQAPHIKATGNDTNIDVHIEGKGTGLIYANGNEIGTKNDYIRLPGYGTTAGTANAYTLTPSPALAAYTDGVIFAMQIHAANTGASTINISGLGVKNLLDSKGVALTSGKLKLYCIYTFRYNGTSFFLQGDGGSGDAVASNLLLGKTASVDAGDIVGSMVDRSGTTITAGATSGGNPQSSYFEYDVAVGVTGYVSATTKIRNHITNLTAGNLVSGVTLTELGLTGTYAAKQYVISSIATSSTFNGTYSGYAISVTGLPFTPKFIVVSYLYSSTWVYQMYTVAPYFVNTQANSQIIIGNTTAGCIPNWVVTANGFSCYTSYQTTVNYTVFG